MAEEEQVLLSLSKELVANGWKSDNGLPRYLNKLQENMAKAIPGCTLCGDPHINSKINVWKRYHSSLSAMIGGRPKCSQHVIQALAYDTGLEGSFWKLKDRATGATVEDVMDAVNEMLNEDVQPDSDDMMNTNASNTRLFVFILFYFYYNFIL